VVDSICQHSHIRLPVQKDKN